MDATIRGLRALNFEAAFNEEVAARKKGLLKIKPPKDEDERRKIEKEIRHYKKKSRFVTPLIKYLAGEESVRMARMTMQIMGGVGYMTEYGAEKLLRDALVLPIYEGTSQIQSLMALKDNLQAAMRNPRKTLAGVASNRLEAIRANDPLDRGVARLRGISFSAMQTIMTRIAADKLGDLRGRPLLEWKSSFLQDWDPARDFSFGLLHAERYTRILCQVAVAEVLVKQAHQVAGTEHEEERRELAERWIERAEPRCNGILGEIEATGGSLLGRLLGRGDDDEEAENAA
jgi:hypothetical protein